jgi:Pre-mRNA-splicing factor of RES complex
VPLIIDFSKEKMEKKPKLEEIKKDPTLEIIKIAEQFKNAETIYRDKQGKIIQNIIDYKGEEEARKEELRKKNEERIGEWGSGAYQKKMQEDRKKYEISLIKNKENFSYFIHNYFLRKTNRRFKKSKVRKL